MKKKAGVAGFPISLSEAARRLDLRRPYLYGVLLALRIVPGQPRTREGPGRAPRTLTREQFERVERGLKGVT